MSNEQQPQELTNQELENVQGGTGGDGRQPTIANRMTLSVESEIQKNRVIDE